MSVYADVDAARGLRRRRVRDTLRRIEILWTVAARQVDDGQPSGGTTRTGRLIVQGGLG